MLYVIEQNIPIGLIDEYKSIQGIFPRNKH